MAQVRFMWIILVLFVGYVNGYSIELDSQITRSRETGNWSECIEILENILPTSSPEHLQLQQIKHISPLPWISAEWGFTDLISVLISHGLPVNEPLETAKNTMLHLAAANGHLNLVLFLADNGANLEAKDRTGWTAVHYAALSGHVHILKFLVGRGCNVNIKNTSVGYTALHYAVWFGRISVVDYLINHTDCDKSISSYDGNTALDIAERDGYDTIIRMLSE